MLDGCRLLVIGSTGDLGSGCVRYFAAQVAELLLYAPNAARLDKQRREINEMANGVRCSSQLDELLPLADVVICVASLPGSTLSLKGCKPGTLICDAGYPRNVQVCAGDATNAQVFLGGLGEVLGGTDVPPHLQSAVHDCLLPNIAHGCMLEAPLLALAGRIEPYSFGRGNITPDRIEEIWPIAQEHGFVPFVPDFV